MTREERSALVMAAIANSLEKNIQVTTDYPDNNSDARMPALDMKIWVEIVTGFPLISHHSIRRPWLHDSQS